jgi:hypothetical protein
MRPAVWKSDSPAETRASGGFPTPRLASVGVRMVVAFLLAAFCGGGPLQAAPKEQPTPPPPPMPQVQNVSIFRGRTVEIPLRAIGRAPSQLKFLIRTAPKYGRLGEIRFTSRKTAVITYHHDEKAAAGYDSFTYAVQAVDSAVSAPATVHLAISEEPAALAVVHTLDFGRLWVGESREEEISIRNTGGGSLAGRLIVSEPWRILGSPEYRLARREEKKVRILFTPTDAGEFAARLVFSHDSRSSVTLSGGAADPLEFEPAREVELSAAPGQTQRTGTLTIRNLTSTDRVVEVSAPEAIEVPEEVSVPAKGEAAVDLRTRAGFLGGLEDRIDLQSDGYQRSLPLRVFAVPPLLTAEPATLDFGVLPVKSPSRRTLVVRNAGGSPARLRIDAPPEILLLPDPNAAVLAPGEKRSFEVELEISSPGVWKKNITFTTERAAALNIPVQASGTGAGLEQADREPRRTPAGPAAAAPVPSILPEENAGEPFNAIPAISPVRTSSLSPTSIELTWKKPAPNAVSPLIEYRQIEPSASGPPKIRWIKWQGASFREESGNVVAVLANLPRGRSWSLRISSLDETGRRSAPSSTLRLVTPRAPGIPWLWWVLGILGAAAVACAVTLIRRQRQTEAAADEERLSRLGKT